MGANEARLAALLFQQYGENYTPAEQLRIKQGIAMLVAGTIQLANDDQTSDFGNNKTGAGQATVGKGQKGKTRAQPRQYGGKFGKKAKNNGEQAAPNTPQIDPEQIIGTINNLQLGQSVMLLGNNAKVKRLSNGYQVVKMDGSVNEVVKTVGEATKWARGVMQRAPRGGEAGK